MGWRTKTEIAIDLYNKIRKYIGKGDRKIVAKIIYNIFRSYNADAWEGDSKLEEDAEIDYDDINDELPEGYDSFDDEDDEYEFDHELHEVTTNNDFDFDDYDNDEDDIDIFSDT